MGVLKCIALFTTSVWRHDKLFLGSVPQHKHYFVKAVRTSVTVFLHCCKVSTQGQDLVLQLCLLQNLRSIQAWQCIATMVKRHSNLS